MPCFQWETHAEKRARGERLGGENMHRKRTLRGGSPLPCRTTGTPEAKTAAARTQISKERPIGTRSARSEYLLACLELIDYMKYGMYYIML